MRTLRKRSPGQVEWNRCNTKFAHSPTVLYPEFVGLYLFEGFDPTTSSLKISHIRGFSQFNGYAISGRLKLVSTGFFQIDLADGIKLECRPHAWTEDDKPVYTRTGKIAKAMPFPEDIVRYSILKFRYNTVMLQVNITKHTNDVCLNLFMKGNKEKVFLEVA